MIHFLEIVVREKGEDDYRAFLDWADDSCMKRYQLRGYGKTPSFAVDDAFQKYNSADRDFYIEHVEEWK